jgi:hypothetical protein
LSYYGGAQAQAETMKSFDRGSIIPKEVFSEQCLSGKWTYSKKLITWQIQIQPRVSDTDFWFSIGG